MTEIGVQEKEGGRERGRAEWRSSRRWLQWGVGVFLLLWSIAGKPAVICLSTDQLYRSVWMSRMEGASRERPWLETHTTPLYLGLNLQGTVDEDIFCTLTEKQKERHSGNEALERLWSPGLQLHRGVWCESVFIACICVMLAIAGAVCCCAACSFHL